MLINKVTCYCKTKGFHQIVKLKTLSIIPVIWCVEKTVQLQVARYQFCQRSLTLTDKKSDKWKKTQQQHPSIQCIPSITSNTCDTSCMIPTCFSVERNYYAHIHKFTQLAKNVWFLHEPVLRVSHIFSSLVGV